METYIALIRGINVGGNNRISMAELKTLCEKLGFEKVRTYINSGNIIFKISAISATADVKRTEEKIEEQLENALQKEMGLSPSNKVMVRSGKAMKKLASAIPTEWKNDDAQRTDILFLTDEFNSKKTLDLIKINSAVDELMYVATGKAIVWHFKRKDYTKSRMHDFIGTTVYKNMTARNVNTVRKLVELCENKK